MPDQPIEINHAVHKHGNKFHVIGAGLGIWNYSSVAEAVLHEPGSFNLVNPDIRDTVVTNFTLFNGPEWVAFRYHSNNPGPWLLHCHVETHLAGGMGIAILDGVDKWPKIPKEYKKGANGFL
jgi:FtsP/CotA-like multicopper oxidase with cupredoxin domain